MEFSIEETIHSYDTDWQGVVNFGRYSRLVSDAIEEAYLKAFGKLTPIFGDITPVTRRYEIDYLRPLRFGDKVKVNVKFSKNGEHSIKVDFEIMKGGELCAKGSKILVFINLKTWEKAKMPPEIEDLLQSSQDH